MSIQSLRGLAVVLMVAGHVIGATADRGMNVADDSVWRYMYVGLEDIRMPLFTVLSGYVYAMRPVRSSADFPSLLRGKTRRLLIPLLTVGVLLFAMQLVVPGTNAAPELSEFWRVYVYGYDHLWFLQSIFLIFLVAAVLDITGALDTRRGWAMCTGVSLVLFVAARLPADLNLFSINGALRLLPFFLIGYGMRRHDLLDLRGRAAAIAAIAFAAVYAIRVTVIVDAWNPDPFTRRAISLVVGLLGIVLIYSARRYLTARSLAWIGGFSFGIYLFHVFGSAGTRIALNRLDITTEVLVFGVCLVAGVMIPVVFQLIAGKWNPVRVALLGEKPIAKEPAAAK